MKNLGWTREFLVSLLTTEFCDSKSEEGHKSFFVVKTVILCITSLVGMLTILQINTKF